MKKLLSKTQLKKKQQRNQLISGSVLVVLMVFSTIAYSFMDQSSDSTSTSKIIYNGVEFTMQEEYFIGEKYDNKIILMNNPKLIDKDIYTNITQTLSDYSNEPLYISSEDYLSTIEINQNLGQDINQIAQRVQMACYINEENCTENYPVKDCSNNLILVRYSNTSFITSFDNCILISGPQENITQITDLFMIKLFEL